MTPEEIKQYIVNKLAPKIRATFQEPEFLAAWGALDTAERTALIQSSLASDDEAAGRHIRNMLNSYARDLARNRADEITANGTMDLAEFSEVFG